MPSASRQITVFLAVMVMMCGIPSLYLGIGGYLAVTGSDRLPFALLALCGAGMLCFPVLDIRRHRRDVRRETLHRAEIVAAIRRAPGDAAKEVLASGEPILAHWTYEEEHGDPGRAEAVITPTAVVLNGRYHVLTGGQFELHGVSDHTGDLCFDVGGQGTGEYSKMVRVPVPLGREAEARALARAFERSLHGDEPAWPGRVPSAGH